MLLIFTNGRVSSSGWLSHSPDTPLSQRTMAALLWIVACGLLISVPAALATRQPLSPFLSYHETVDYDLDALVWHHRRLTRSYMGRREMNLQFDALGRSFNLLLFPDSSLFHKDVVLHSSHGPVKGVGLRSSTYSGYDLNEPGSRVHGNMLAGVFDGVVYTDKDIFYIEPAHRYTRDTSAHTIIYRHSDINGEALNGARCGLGVTSIRESLERVTRSMKKSEEGKSEEGRGEDVRERRQNTNKVRCWLSVIGDYKFYEEVTRSVSGGQEVKESVAASLLVSIIQAASNIFQETNFDDSADQSADNIQFGVKNMTIETERPTSGPFANEFLGVEAYLQHHSESDTSDYCLSYRFTYRDFDGGVLGLAYVASLGAAGGICETRLNTGIVTLLNFRRRVPTAVTTLTMAHEAGHNFGSEHDPETDDDCVPSGGKYIMYAFATDGTQGNNDEFSPCSRRMMNRIIQSRGQGDGGCFVDADDLCGNGLVDEGEDCDCGIDFNEGTKLCNNDRCCNGSNCTLTAAAQCSPDQGDCCNPENCMFYMDSDNELCAPETDCGLDTFCDGLSATCPPAEARMPSGNDTFILCNNGSATCVGNVCNGSFCEVLSTDSCTCNNDEQFCHVCCMINGQCLSTIEAAASNATLAAMLPDGEGEFLPIGHPCNDFRGYCDFLHNCFDVDSEGALERLANIFFNADDLNAAVEWIRDHWWAVLVAGVGLLVGIFFIILIVHLLLPRPEHVKQRAERRRTIRRNRKQGNVHPDPPHYGHEMRVKH